MFEEYRGYLPAQKDTKILDIGCGSGDLLLFLKKAGYRHVYGVDVDRRAIDAARKNGLIEVEDITDLGAFLAKQEGMYNVILAREVIYYFPDDLLVRYLEMINRALAKEGIFIVEVFNGAILTGEFVRNKDRLIRRVFTEGSLRAVLNDSGFEVLNIFGNRFRPAGFKGVLWLSLQRVWFFVLSIIYILERGLDPNNPKIFSKSLIAVAKKR